METSRGVADHVEKWMSWIPGIGTYRDREKRRETDKRIRECVAEGLQEVRGHLKRIMLEFSRKGQADLLIDLDHLSSQIQQMADSIRYASYGYGGIFDLEKIREDELNRLCSFDLSLKEEAEKLEGKVREIEPTLSPDDLKKKMIECGAVIVNLQGSFRKRKEFMSRKA